MLGKLHSSEWKHLVIVILFGLALYVPTLFHGFTLDDDMAIAGNTFTLQGLAGILPILTTDTWQGYFGEAVELLPWGRYRPLSLVTFALEHALFGDAPLAHHLGNILIYGLTGAMIYLLLLQLLRSVTNQLFADWSRQVALATALIFMAHPLHTEAVANIKGRDELLALLLALGALFLFLSAGRTGKTWPLATGAGLFLLATLSKENAFTFIAVVPLATYCFVDEWKPAVRRAMPWLGGAAALYLVIRFSVLGFGSGASDHPGNILNNPFLGLSAAETYATITHTLGRYLMLLVMPHPLTHDYYPKTIPVMTWTHWSVMISLVLHGLALGWALWKVKTRCRVAFFILFYLLTLFPVSNIPFTVGTNMAERFLYMPSLGACAVAALILARLGHRISTAGPLKSVQPGTATLLLALLVVIPFSLKSLHREQAWMDNITLFSTDIAVSGESAKLRNALGCELLIESSLPENSTRRGEILAAAVGHLEQAVHLYPGNTQSWTGLGDAAYLRKDYATAVNHYEKSLALVPESLMARERKALALTDWGKAAFAGGRYEEARSRVEQAVATVDYNPDSWVTLGAALGKLGRPADAIEAFQRAVQINDRFAPAYLNLGAAYLHQGDQERGRIYLEKAYRLDPSLRRP